MKHIPYLLLLAGLFLCGRSSAQSAPATYAEKVQQYIATYKDLAMAEQQRSGIPAAVTLAQGILESSAGESELATAAANHFGIKCKKTWTGETYIHTDDAPDECFRKYSSAEASYRDHSDYLKAQGRYEPCFAQSATDYAAWAVQLKKCGYATSPTYAQRLIRIIEDYKLQQYTYAALDREDPLRRAASGRTASAGENVPEKDAPIAAPPVMVKEVSTPAETRVNSTVPDTRQATAGAPVETRTAAHPASPVNPDGTTMQDGRRGFRAKKGDVLLEDAIRHRIRYAKLLEINGLPDEPLSADRFVFLEKAGSTRVLTVAAGRDESARVAAGEPARPSASNSVAPVVVVHNAAPAAATGLKESSESTAVPKQERSSAGSSEAAAAPASTSALAEPVLNASPEPALAAAPAEGAPITEDNSAAPLLASAGSPVSEAMAAERLTESAPGNNSAPDAQGTNIADESAVEEEEPATAVPEPLDEVSRLKARFDKAVYAPVKKSVADPAPASAPLLKAAPVAASASSAGTRFHTVQKGETAFGIAKKYGITVRQLQEWNSLLMESGVPLGRKLKVQP